ncbi:MAG: metallophosphoesterase family protein [Candidatus Brockarchaeota archaeon]|nr:metallophosphoesterase family protein [Candidatus Brockarchaeota archaeon]MBO3768239.1 metallophosphoesterase family protein [Candidatus Brockarchaeota archaeon]MBO3801445.1 metallophosphoesterase family protein [Candidatus Brockarchaeota archaeon]
MSKGVIKTFREPALILNNEYLVVSDLHIGFEKELRDKGINVPEKSSEFSERLLNLLKTHKLKKLIIAGDLKHKVSGISLLESLVVTRNFLNLFLDLEEVHLVPGNHDGDILGLLPSKVKVHNVMGFEVNGSWISHGHARLPKEALSKDYIILGHIHPVVKITDNSGYSYTIQVWLERINKKPKVIIMPAFNNYVGYLTVNNDNFRMPALRMLNISIEDMNVTTLDGYNLGLVKDIVAQ